MNLSWIGLGRTSSCTSSTGWPKSIPCRYGVREVVLSWWRTPELKEGPSSSWWIADSPLFLYARSGRTCSRRCRHPSMINVLCTAFWVPCRVIRTIRCSQLHESFVLILDWRDWMIDFCRRSCWRACRFGWFSIFWTNSRTLALCACFTIECGSPGVFKSMSSSILSRIVSLSVLSFLISWFTSGAARSAISCLSGSPDRSWVCSTRISSDRFVVISGCPSMKNILYTAFWVPCRAKLTFQCFQLHESCVFWLWNEGLNGRFCHRSCWRACGFGWFSNFLNQLSNAGTLRVFHNGMW